jgi:hypothetical protein
MADLGSIEAIPPREDHTIAIDELREQAGA